MDMKKTENSQSRNDVPDLTGRLLAVGAKQLRKAVKNHRAEVVFLAENADPAVTEPLQSLCMEQCIPITWVADMADLGRACGIEVAAAACAVLHP